MIIKTKAWTQNIRQGDQAAVTIIINPRPQICHEIIWVQAISYTHHYCWKAPHFYVWGVSKLLYQWLHFKSCGLRFMMIVTADQSPCRTFWVQAFVSMITSCFDAGSSGAISFASDSSRCILSSSCLWILNSPPCRWLSMAANYSAINMFFASMSLFFFFVSEASVVENGAW